MKLSELKSIIRECIEELNESGPSRRYKRTHGIRIKSTGSDHLEKRMSTKDLKGDMKDHAKRFKYDTNLHDKYAVGGSKQLNKIRQIDMDYSGKGHIEKPKGKLTK